MAKVTFYQISWNLNNLDLLISFTKLLVEFSALIQTASGDLLNFCEKAVDSVTHTLFFTCLHFSWVFLKGPKYTRGKHLLALGVPLPFIRSNGTPSANKCFPRV